MPTASEPLEQAEVVQKLGPRAPSVMDACAEAMLGIIIGMRKGLTLSAPLSSRTLVCSKRVVRPPMPLPIIMPMSSLLLSSIFNSACLVASRLAATAICEKRSLRRASLGFI